MPLDELRVGLVSVTSRQPRRGVASRRVRSSARRRSSSGRCCLARGLVEGMCVRVPGMTCRPPRPDGSFVRPCSTLAGGGSSSAPASTERKWSMRCGAVTTYLGLARGSSGAPSRVVTRAVARCWDRPPLRPLDLWLGVFGTAGASAPLSALVGRAASSQLLRRASGGGNTVGPGGGADVTEATRC